MSATFTVSVASQSHRWLLVHPRTTRLANGTYRCPDCGATSLDPDALLRLKCSVITVDTDPTYRALQGSTPIKPRLGDTWKHPGFGILYAVHGDGFDHWWNPRDGMRYAGQQVHIQGVNPHVVVIDGREERVFIDSSEESAEMHHVLWKKELGESLATFITNAGWLTLEPVQFEFVDKGGSLVEIKIKVRARSHTLYEGGTP